MELLPDFSFPKDECEWTCRPATPKQAGLAMSLARHEVVAIPTVIGGRIKFSIDGFEVRSPHDRSCTVKESDMAHNTRSFGE